MTLLSNTHGTFKKFDHAQEHKTSLIRVQILCIVQIIVCDHDAIKLACDKKKKSPLHISKIKRSILKLFMGQRRCYNRNLEMLRNG